MPEGPELRYLREKLKKKIKQLIVIQILSMMQKKILI